MPVEAAADTLQKTEPAPVCECPYEAFNGWIVVNRDTPKKYEGTIEIPGMARVVKNSGTVIETSDDARTAYGLEVGSRVLFPLHAGVQQHVRLDGEDREFLFLKCDELIGKLKG